MRSQLLGGGIGLERAAGGSLTARKRTGGDFQSNGDGGSGSGR